MCECLDRGDGTAHVDECCYEDWLAFQEGQKTGIYMLEARTQIAAKDAELARLRSQVAESTRLCAASQNANAQTQLLNCKQQKQVEAYAKVAESAKRLLAHEDSATYRTGLDACLEADYLRDDLERAKACGALP